MATAWHQERYWKDVVRKASATVCREPHMQMTPGPCFEDPASSLLAASVAVATEACMRQALSCHMCNSTSHKQWQYFNRHFTSHK